MSQQDGSSGASAPSELKPEKELSIDASLRRIAHHLENFDRSLLDLTTGLETLHTDSEHTNTLLNHILLQNEQATTFSNGEHRELMRVMENSHIRAENAAATAQEDARRQAHGFILAHQRIIAEIAPQTRAAQAANVAEAATLLRDLLVDVLTTKLWVGRKLRGLFGWAWETEFPFWLGISLTLLMVIIKFYGIKDQINAPDTKTGIGGPESTGRIENILAGNPGWKKLLEEPRPVLSDFFLRHFD